MVKNDPGVHGSNIQCGCGIKDGHVDPVLLCHISHVVDVKVVGVVEGDLARSNVVGGVLHRYLEMLTGEPEFDKLCNILWLYQQVEHHLIHVGGGDVISDLWLFTLHGLCPLGGRPHIPLRDLW